MNADGYFVLFLVVGVVAHELGHALVAAALGGRVESITIGSGPRVVSLPAGTLRLTLRLVPLSGLTVWSGPPSQRRWTRLAVALAGCAVNLACVLGAVLSRAHSAATDQLIVASLALACYNLIPVRTFGGDPLDGLTALRLLRGSAETITTEQLVAAGREPESAGAQALRRQLRRAVDHDRDIRAARLLVQLPGGEPGRGARPATEDLERVRALVNDELLPPGRRATLAYQAATTGLPGLAGPLDDAEAGPVTAAPDAEELSWCASMLSYAAQLAPRAWPILQAWALSLSLQGPEHAPRALELARQAVDWAPVDTPPPSVAILQATAAFAAALAGGYPEAAQRRRRAGELDPRCPTLPLVDAVLAGRGASGPAVGR